MSRQSRHRSRERLAAIAQAHELTAEEAQSFATRNEAKQAREFVARPIVSQRNGVFDYSQPVYGKYYSPEKQAERDAKMAAKRAKNREVYLQGGFVSETHFVAYVKRLLEHFGESQFVAGAILFVYEKALLSWERPKVDALVVRAEEWYEWKQNRSTVGVADPSCNNARHPAQGQVSRGVALRREAAESASAREKYLEWLKDRGHLVREWEVMSTDATRLYRADETLRKVAAVNDRLRKLADTPHLDASESNGFYRFRENIDRLYIAHIREEQRQLQRYLEFLDKL